MNHSNHISHFCHVAEFSDDISRKEESARLLCRLISSAHQLIKPYVEPIIDALLPKIKDAHPHLASCLLATLGELAAVGGRDWPYFSSVLTRTFMSLFHSRKRYDSVHPRSHASDNQHAARQELCNKTRGSAEHPHSPL